MRSLKGKLIVLKAREDYIRIYRTSFEKCPSVKRYDGTEYEEFRNAEALATEDFTCQFFDQPFNGPLIWRENEIINDNGIDFYFGRACVDVIHLGVMDNGEPRANGHFLVQPRKINNPTKTDVYLSVGGSLDTEFKILGFYPHRYVTRLPRIPQRNIPINYPYGCKVGKLPRVFNGLWEWYYGTFCKGL